MDVCENHAHVCKYILDHLYRRWCGRALPLQSAERYAPTEKTQDHFLVMDGHGLDRRSNDFSKLNSEV